MSNLDEWLEIGSIVAPHGLNGEVRVYPNSDFPERFLTPGQRWLLRPNATEPEPIQLKAGRFVEGKGVYVLRLEGVRYRDQAEQLRNSRLLVPESDRPVLEEDEYHVVDLLGISVFDHVTGQHIGVIKDVIPAGNDLLEIELVRPDAEQPEDHPSPLISQSANDGGESESARASSSTPINDQTSSLRKKGRKAKLKQAKKKAPQPPTVLVPFVPEIVPVVDLKAGRITITPPPGLLDTESVNA